MKRSLVALLFVAALLPGCKKPVALATGDAQNILQTALFSGPSATQTLELVSGAVASHPLALNQFLYAKHWFDCTATSPGTFTTSAICRVNAEARSFGTANGWSWLPGPASGCQRCETVHVPVASAKLTRVDAVDVLDAAHATVTYSYEVVPNQFGVQLAAWMAGHGLAWCGPDPSVRGGWNAPRSVHSAFVRSEAGWLPVQPQPDFAAAFGASAAAEGDKPCPAS